MATLLMSSTPMSSFHSFAATAPQDLPTPSQQTTSIFIPQATKASLPSLNNPTTIVNASTDDVDTYASWSVQWVNMEKERIWAVGTPQFKFCKKRKEFYSDDMPTTWYKAPYKYHMSLEVANMDENEPVTALLDLQFEDGQKVVYNTKSNAKRSKKTPPSSQHELSSGVVSNNENTFSHNSKGKSEVTIGPFTFNCCSYKFDGRKFRLVLYLLNQTGICCYLYSSPILIRAKKPIVNKGSKSKNSTGKKRKNSDSEEDTDSNDDEVAARPEKKQKLMGLAPVQVPVPPHHGMLLDAVTQQPVMLASQQPPNIMLSHQSPPASMVSLMNAAAAVTTNSNNPMMDMSQTNHNAPNLAFADTSAMMFSPPSPTTKWYHSSAFLGEHGLLFSDKPLSGLEKVQTIVETFEAMDDKDRKELLDKLFERASYPEREFIKRKYFTDTWESRTTSSNTTTTTTTSNNNAVTSTSSHQQQQPSTSSDVDNIFTGLLNWQ